MKFNLPNCEILHMDHHNPKYQFTTGRQDLTKKSKKRIQE
jgi:hypothetical protein